MTQEEKLDRLNELKNKMEADRKEFDSIKEELLSSMEKDGIEQLSNNYITASIRASSFRTTIKTDELKEKYPSVFHEISKRTEIKSSLTIKKIKKDK